MESGINKKLKILWFSNTDAGYNMDSDKQEKKLSGTWMSAIVSAFKNENFDLELGIVFKSNKILQNKKIEFISYFPIYDYRNNSKIKKQINRIRRKILYYDYIKDYIKIVDLFKPDIIHIFGSEQDYGLLCKYINTPLVLSIQGNLTIWEWKYFSGLSKFQTIFYEKLFRNLFFLGQYNDYKIFKKKAIREIEIFKSLKYIIGRTDWDRRIASILAPKAKYFYNDEVLRDKFFTAEIVKPKITKRIIISTVSRPALYKGLEVVYKTSKLLDDININFEWNIIGVNKKDSIVRLIKKKYKNNFNKININLLGSLDEVEMIEVLKKTNIYVMPSHIENGSIALSEAMILGLPTITTLAGGTDSRLKNQKEGLLIQNGDPWSMAGAILELVNNYDRAIEYGQNAHKRAKYRHNPSKVVKDLINIYIEINKNES